MVLALQILLISLIILFLKAFKILEVKVVPNDTLALKELKRTKYTCRCVAG